MQQEIKLSIIIPVYNTQAYLVRCLDSLRAQTLDCFEVIIVDDCSDEPVRPERKETDHFTLSCYRLDHRGGPGGARNKGMDVARGTYVTFCDSDDWIDATYCEEAVNLLNALEADIAMCSLVRNYDIPQKEKVYKCHYTSMITLTGEMSLRILTKEYDFGFSIIPSSTNKVYRKAYLDDNSIRFTENTMFEDLFFSFIAMIKAHKIVTVPNVCYHHYRRKHSITQSISTKHIDDYVTIFELLRKQLEQENLYEMFRNNYYQFAEQFYNLIIREIFEFEPTEAGKKHLISYSFKKIKQLLRFEEYLSYCSAEKLRQHIQPLINDTTIY